MTAAPDRPRWIIAEGCIPPESHGPEPEMPSHETACLLNAGDAPANADMTLHFPDREPAGPCRRQASARRTLRVRFNVLTDPEPVPRGADCASVIVSDRPAAVQRSRLDSREAESTLMTTPACPAS